MAKKTEPPAKAPTVECLTIEQIAQRHQLTVPQVEELATRPDFPVPSVEGYPADLVATYLLNCVKCIPREENAAPAEPPPPATRYLTLQIPIGTPENHSYIKNCMGHVECKIHSQRELPGLRKFLAGAVEVSLKDYQGKPIATQRDLVKWLFRHVTEQLEKLQTPAESTSAA